MTEFVAQSVLARAIGFALVDFLWQGAVIGVLTAAGLVALRRSRADLRYLVACAGLAAMFVAPILTTAAYLQSDVVLERPPAQPPVVVATRSMPMTMTPSTSEAIVHPRVEPWLPLVLSIWSGGVAVLGLRLLRGWRRVARLRRRATPLSTSPWPDTVRTMAQRLGIARRLQLVQSSLVPVPAVLGWLRPVIVVPASALAMLPPAHLEAILAHELAHIRRADYLVNVLQCLVEILLFYHPAVWWVSRQVRVERELCCDDVAATLCADRVAYARALASLEELQAKTPSLAMASSGGDLLHRVRRLVDPESASGPKWSGGMAMGVVFTIALIALGGQVQSQSPPPAPAPVPATAPAPAPALALALAPAAVPIPVRTLQQPQQPGRGRVVGSVRDRDGGVVPGATVTVVSPASAARSVTTNTTGRFEFADLPPGPVDLAISLAGFRTARVRVLVNPDRDATAAVRLDLGTLQESVSVRGERPASAEVAINTADPKVAAALLGRAPEAASQLLDAAKTLYEQGRFDEAAELTSRALDAMKTGMFRPAPPLPPPPPAALASPNAPQVPIRVGGDIREPRKISHVRPVYPADALALGISGTVILDATVDKDGVVQDLKLLKSVPLLDQAAIEAVRQWRYTPTLLNNVPVPVQMVVSVTFEAR